MRVLAAATCTHGNSCCIVVRKAPRELRGLQSRARKGRRCAGTYLSLTSPAHQRWCVSVPHNSGRRQRVESSRNSDRLRLGLYRTMREKKNGSKPLSLSLCASGFIKSLRPSPAAVASPRLNQGRGKPDKQVARQLRRQTRQLTSCHCLLPTHLASSHTHLVSGPGTLLPSRPVPGTHPPRRLQAASSSGLASHLGPTSAQDQEKTLFDSEDKTQKRDHDPRRSGSHDIQRR